MTAARAIAAGALLGVTLAVPSHPVEVMRPVAVAVGVLVFCAEVLGAVFGGRK